MRAQLASHVFDNARVLAFQHPLVAPPPLGFRGGPVIADPAHAQLRHTRYWQPVDSFLNDAKFATVIPDELQYAGPIYHHFGHYMSEMAHRFLPTIKRFDPKRWLFVGPEQASAPDAQHNFPTFLKEVLSFFGIGHEKITVINQNSIIRSLGIVEQGSDFGGGPKPGYLGDLRDFSEPRLNEYPSPSAVSKKVYVSRRHMPVSGSFLGERYLEELLEDEGFVIYFPEKHSLIHQMKTYSASEVLVFSEGSACHGTELLGEQALNRCYLLVRRADHKDIFSRVLSPRSQHFAIFEDTFYLGSIVGRKGEAVSGYHGVSVFNCDSLIASLRENRIARLDSFDKSRFLDSVERDMGRYILQNIAAETVSSLEHIAAVVSQLARLRLD